MPSLTEWKVPLASQPRAGDYSFDLDRVLSSVVGLQDRKSTRLNSSHT